MNNHRAILAVFLPMTALIVILDNAYPGATAVYYIKYTVISMLFLTAVMIRKKYHEQKALHAALFFVVLADYFFVFSKTIAELDMAKKILGSMGFLLAYTILITVFQKNFKLGKGELLAAIPVLGVYIPSFVALKPFFTGAMLYGAALFGLILCCMAWTAVSTIFRGYYNIQTSRKIALAGYLMLLSDIGVAHAVFNPAYAYGFVPWLSNFIWATYVPAWTLILLVIADEKIH